MPQAYLSVCTIYRDAAPYLREWMEFLTGLAADAVERGELRAGTDAQAIAYEAESLGVCAVMQAPLLGTEVTFRHARNAMLGHLRALATDPSILPEPS